MISRRNRKVGLRLKPVLSLEVLRGPTGSVWAYGAKVDVDELEVRLSVSSSWLDTLRSFLDLPDVADSFSEIEVMAMNQLHTAEDQLDAKLEFLRRTHIRIKAEVKIHAPVLTILPPWVDPNVEHMAALQIEVDDITLKTLVDEDAVQDFADAVRHDQALLPSACREPGTFQALSKGDVTKLHQRLKITKEQIYLAYECFKLVQVEDGNQDHDKSFRLMVKRRLWNQN